MKRADRQRRERALETHGREEAEWLAIKALLDHRIPDSEQLVRAVKNPLFLNELSARGTGPTGVTHATDVVRRYARVIAQRTSGDAQSVQQHFMQLIGKERAAELGVSLAKLKVTSQPASAGTVAGVICSGRDIVAVAGYLVLPDHLNLGNLPPNPFGSPRVTGLMERMKALNYQARRTPENTQGVGLNSAQLGDRVEKLAEVAAHEISRAIPGNEAREAALKAMRLSGCLETYTPQVVRQAGWQDIRVHDADPVTGQPVPGTRKIAVYDVTPGEPGSPTRYRHRAGQHHALVYGLLNLYAA